MQQEYVVDIGSDISQGFACRKFRELNVLFKAAMVSNLGMEFKVSLHVLCDLISEMIDHDLALVYLRNNDQQSLQPFVVRGLQGKLPDPFREGNRFTEWSMTSQQTLLVASGSQPEAAEILAALGASSMISVPIHASSNVIGAIQIFSRKTQHLTHDDAKLLSLLMTQSESLFTNLEGLEQLDALAARRPAQAQLSQLHEHLHREIGRAQRRKTPLSIVMISIDNWRDYGEKYGQLAEARTSNEFAALLMNQVRRIDTLCPYDEGRFVLILTETDRMGGRLFAERLREMVGRHLFAGAEGTRSVNLTMSAALVTYPFDGRGEGALMEAAEHALRVARDAGGNQVCQNTGGAQQAPSAPTAPEPVDFDQVTRTIESISNMDSVLEMMVELAMQTVSAEKSSLLLALNSSDQFAIRVACGFGKHTELIRHTKIPGAGSVTGWVAKLKKPVASENIEKIGAVHHNLYRDYHNNSFLSIPILAGDKTLGVLHLSNKREGGVFTEKHVKQLRPLAEHLSYFLKEGLRFEKRQRHFAREALASLAVILDAKDPYCVRHSELVSHYATELARELGMSDKAVERMGLSAKLHDLGKIAIRSDLAHKPGDLTQEEVAIMQRHPFLSWKILDGLALGDDGVKNTVLHHHEKLDGSGYPYGLIGDQIPLPARILAVADTFVAMTSQRPHRPAFQEKDALREMGTLVNRHYDPHVLEKLKEITARRHGGVSGRS
ncbi:MAG: GAF domain-containing protein [bacterium]|nr:GAF domain-containing protein [bacterium]